MSFTTSVTWNVGLVSANSNSLINLCLKELRIIMVRVEQYIIRRLRDNKTRWRMAINITEFTAGQGHCTFQFYIIYQLLVWVPCIDEAFPVGIKFIDLWPNTAHMSTLYYCLGGVDTACCRVLRYTYCSIQQIFHYELLERPCDLIFACVNNVFRLFKDRHLFGFE